MKKKAKLFIILITLISGTGAAVVRTVFEGAFTMNRDPKAIFHRATDFNDAEAFVQHGYGEVKDIALQLITVLSGILVFSITFSEKIVRFSSSTHTIRTIVVCGWALIILAVIATGIGLAFNAFALPCALSDSHSNTMGRYQDSFYAPSELSLTAIMIGGFWFILALVCMLLAGISSISDRSAAGLVEQG